VRIRECSRSGYERVVIADDPAHSLLAIIALHNLRRGPGLGGTRLMHYRSLDEGIEDALRLAQGMSLKSAFAELPFGGAKGVIIAPAGPFDRSSLMKAYGRFVNMLEGAFVTGEDVGTTPSDAALMRLETGHVLAESAVTVDSAQATATTVFRAMRAAIGMRFGSADFADRLVAIQGVGAVGSGLAHSLKAAGARLCVADALPERASTVARDTAAEIISAGRIVSTACDVVAPCALGGVLNATSVPTLRASVVVGGANNQLSHPDDARRMHERNVLYVPDFVANVGGVIAACTDLLGWRREEVFARLDDTERRTRELLTQAREAMRPPLDLAMATALNNLS
jgi:leucine dehydrogenase